MFASRLSLLLATAILMAGCRDDSEPNPTPTPTPAPSPSPSPTPSPTPTPGQTVRVPFNFERDFGGWTSDVSDYTQGTEADVAFSATIAAVPPQVTARSGLRLSSRSARVYVWRAVDGLAPNARYRVDAQLTIAANTPPGCPGVGGPPGESVKVYVGATTRQPAKSVGQGGKIVPNFDSAGNEFRTVGDLATPGAGSCSNNFYALKQLSTDGRGPVVSADASGRLWAVFTTTSGFAGVTDMWLLDGSFTLSPA